MRGLPPPQVAWPTDDPGLSRAQFRQLQQLLLDRGHCGMRVDGAEGPRTAAAIRAEEERLGWPPTGRAGSRLLAALQEMRAEAVPCPVAER